MTQQTLELNNQPVWQQLIRIGGNLKLGYLRGDNRYQQWVLKLPGKVGRMYNMYILGRPEEVAASIPSGWTDWRPFGRLLRVLPAIAEAPRKYGLGALDIAQTLNEDRIKPFLLSLPSSYKVGGRIVRITREELAEIAEGLDHWLIGKRIVQELLLRNEQSRQLTVTLPAELCNSLADEAQQRMKSVGQLVVEILNERYEGSEQA
ncbi:MAG: hypothetical protein H7A35_10000 [Planctomycetales bacterium]|nr:hypothetical protein [bacterium]UNM07206.1 MAG: hypothetical protein H7A35_10000 [Planctomycetales bacterium]